MGKHQFTAPGSNRRPRNNMPSFSPQSLAFPPAQQAQIIRANQRDLFHVSSLREQTESVLRSWLGTRRLTRWEKEVDALIKLVYYGLTTGRATQTLGEEYTDIWQYSSRHRRLPTPLHRRMALIFLSVFPPYLFAKISSNATLNHRNPDLAGSVRQVQRILSVASEVNLALFYLRGTYYDPVKRGLGIKQLSSFPDSPHIRPPSYALLGVMIGIRLIYRVAQELKPCVWQSKATEDLNEGAAPGAMNAFLDDRPINQVIKNQSIDDVPITPAEDDIGTALDVTAIPDELRQSRNCTLCLEERTDSCITECGHLFCWSCIVGWGREKAECPLCRQSLALSKLLPVYNL